MLLGLGVSELSVVPGAIPRLKALIRGLRLEDCRALARARAQLATAAEVRALVREADAMKQIISRLQPIGRALMLPIAVLPVAALLLRLGQPDLLDMPAIAAAGAAIFSNLGLLFAIGVAVGLARENHGAAGLAACRGLPGRHQGRQGAASPCRPRRRGISRTSAAELAAAAFREAELSKLSGAARDAVRPDRRLGVQPLQRHPPA